MNVSSLRLWLVGVLAIVGVSGCVNSTASPSPKPSVITSAIESASVSPNATLMPTRTPTPTPTLTPTSAPTPTPTPKPLAFVATGRTHIARSSATATLLKNGKVLIAGGGDTSGWGTTVYASAELYDPATGTFTKTGSMGAARMYATAVLLQNGKVLIAGGHGCSNPKHCANLSGGSIEYLASAELYDPSTGKFTKTGSMGAIRAFATATLLSDGRVLMDGDALWDELYDPGSGQFVRTGSMPKVASGYNTATSLPNGKILVTHANWGGAELGGPDSEALLYDATNGGFTAVSIALPSSAPLTQYQGLEVPRTAPATATLLSDGRVLFFEDGYLETYDPRTGACANAGFISPAADWYGPTATLLSDGRVLFAGGSLYPRVTDESVGEPTNTAVLYDPADGTFQTGSMSASREYQTATFLPKDGSVLIAGGEDTEGTLTSAELFKP